MWAEVVVVGVKLAFVLAVMLTTVPIMVWVERRGSALIQDRLGPNRVEPYHSREGRDRPYNYNTQYERHARARYHSNSDNFPYWFVLHYDRDIGRDWEEGDTSPGLELPRVNLSQSKRKKRLEKILL